MLFFFKKVFRARKSQRQTPETRDPSKEREREREKSNSSNMPPPNSVTDSSLPCFSACFPAPLHGTSDQTNTKITSTSSRNSKIITTNTTTTTRIARSNFVKFTTSSLFPSTQFTNHESIPPLTEAFSSFSVSFPQYDRTHKADSIRETEYGHLESLTCLDYAGVGLFSQLQMDSDPSVATTSSAHAPPFFDIAYKSASLSSLVNRSDEGMTLELAIKKRITGILSVSDEDYSMVCTANQSTAFRLLAESYSFRTNNRLLTVYDHESEAVNSMAEIARNKSAEVISASFTWPGLRIHSSKLRKKLTKRKRRKGLFVFPLQSRMTGVRYPYLWMKLAQESGWHIVLDACALGPKDMDTLGLSLIQPDFIICNFFKVFGQNPSGFAGLFVKKSSCDALESSAVARSIGIVSIVPARRFSNIRDDNSSTDLSAPNSFILRNEENASREIQETSLVVSEIVEEERGSKPFEMELEIQCRGLDHADSLGLVLISTRLRCITNWLVIALLKLRHPHSENGHSLVKIYGPRVKFDRAPALAFNLFDWKGEKVEPYLVQKLADRHGISLSCGFLRNLLFEGKHEEERNGVLERKDSDGTVVGIRVVNASFGFLSNFEDAYKLWGFVAKFLDADFVEKERWRYMALNQKMVEI